MLIRVRLSINQKFQHSYQASGFHDCPEQQEERNETDYTTAVMVYGSICQEKAPMADIFH